MIRNLLALLPLACAVLPLGAATARTVALLEQGDQPVRIVCFGDSITGAYYHTGGIRAYPELLEIALRRLYPRAQLSVINAGLSGDTTTGGLARLERDVLARQPHLVTIMFGMNDLVKLSLVDFRRNLQDICARIRSAGAEVLLCTQNSVTDTELRPGSKLTEYIEVIRGVGREESITVVDGYALFEAVRTRDPLAWTRLCSDEIHPNLEGHKVFAAAIAKAISGREISLRDVAPPEPSLSHTFAVLEAGEPVKVLAMPPLDQLIGPALLRLYPNAQVEVTTWPTAGQSLAQLEVAAREVRAKAVNLVLLAVPASSSAEVNDTEFHRRYTWVLNWSLSFGPPAWDVLVLPPAVITPTLSTADMLQDARARAVIAGKDLSLVTRRADEGAPFAEWFAGWVTQLRPRSIP